MRYILRCVLVLVLAACSSANAPTPPPAPPTVSDAAQTIEPPTTTIMPPTPPIPTATPPIPTATPPIVPLSWGYPIGWPDRPAGDGFFIRHSYVAENTWYNPGYWHTGEDWYALDNGETAGALVYAVAAGTVVYVGSNYPGLVVIVQHADLFSMYGHLDPAVPVVEGQAVERGTVLGRVLRRTDHVPDHAHVEIRTFLTTPAVNGSSPRFAFRCGPNCPPGPGYWPITDRNLPHDLGWRNPTHIIAQRGFTSLVPPAVSQIVVAAQPISPTVPVWSAAPGPGLSPRLLTEYVLEPGRRLPVFAAAIPPATSQGTSAASYAVWYQIRLADGQLGWVQATVASTFETGSDGQPASVLFNFLPIN